MMPIMNTLKELGRLDALGYAADADWFEMTLHHAFVDPLFRIADSVGPQVENPAPVLVALECGYFYGRPFFEFFTDLMSTHGNLAPVASHGYILCTGKRPKRPMRHRDVPGWLDESPSPAQFAPLDRKTIAPCGVCP